MVRWRDSLGACPIERTLRGCALVVPDLACYPQSPACAENACLRKVTTTTAPNHPKHSANPYREEAQASETSRRLGKSVDTQPGPACLGAGGGVGKSMRAAQAGLEEETPHGHRSSGPWSLAADGDQSPTGPGRPYRPGWRIDRSGGRLSAHSQAKLTGGGLGEEEEVSIREPVRKIVSIWGGHGRGHVVHDHGKDEERITPTGGDGCIRTIAITSGCTLSHRNQCSSGGINQSPCEPFNVNRNHLIKAGRGGDWARLSSKPGSPTTLSKIFGRCAATVSCGQYDASQLDGLRTERRTVVGTVRSVDVCSILLMNHDMTDAQCGSSAIEYLSVGKRCVLFELFVPAW